MTFTVIVPRLYHVTVLDDGWNLDIIEQDILSTGVKKINVIRETCTTDREEQPLNYSITFCTSSKSVVNNILSRYIGFYDEHRRGEQFYEEASNFTHVGTKIEAPMKYVHYSSDLFLPF